MGSIGSAFGRLLGAKRPRVQPVAPPPTEDSVLFGQVSDADRTALMGQSRRQSLARSRNRSLSGTGIEDDDRGTFLSGIDEENALLDERDTEILDDVEQARQARADQQREAERLRRLRLLSMGGGGKRALNRSGRGFV